MVAQNLHSETRTVLTDARYRTGFLAAISVFLSFIVIKPAFAEESKPGMQRVPLLEKAVDLPSNKVNAKIIKVTFPAGFKTPWHTHEGPGPRYVVKGTVKVTEGEKENSYAAGEVFWESGGKMQVENTGQEPAELIIFEMAPGR